MPTLRFCPPASRLLVPLLLLTACAGESATGPVTESRHAATAPGLDDKAIQTVTSAADAGRGTLRQALLDVSPGGTIRFAEALRTGTGACVMNSVAGCTITLTSPLTIDRGVIIEGPGQQRLRISGGDAVRVMNVTGAIAVTLRGLTVADGSDPLVPGAFGDAGGIVVRGGASFTLEASTIRDHVGTGLSILSSDATLTDVTFTGNAAAVVGGALWVGEDAGQGPASATLQRCTIESNSADRGGAGVYVARGTLTITDTRLLRNRATIANVSPVSGVGGALYAIYPASVSLTDVTISENTAALDGGGMYLGAGTNSTLTSTTISNNVAARSGGGIRAKGSVVMLNSLASGNVATEGSGGGIRNDSPSLRLTGTRITSNSAPAGTGGGIANSGLLLLTAASPTVKGSSVCGNSASLVANIGNVVPGSSNGFVSGVNYADTQLSGGTVCGVN